MRHLIFTTKSLPTSCSGDRIAKALLNVRFSLCVDIRAGTGNKHDLFHIYVKYEVNAIKVFASELTNIMLFPESGG